MANTKTKTIQKKQDASFYKSNAVPGLSPGLSHQTCRTACAPFTPSKSG